MGGGFRGFVVGGCHWCFSIAQPVTYSTTPQTSIASAKVAGMDSAYGGSSQAISTQPTP